MATPNDIAATLLVTENQSQATLPEACPICYHEPVKPDDCRPNKALRTTVKVFLRKKVVERETAEKKRLAAEKVAAPAATPPVEETPARQPSETPGTAGPEASTELGSRGNSQAPQSQAEPMKITESNVPTEAQKDVPQKSIESPGPDVARRASTQTAGEGSGDSERANGAEKQSDQQQAANNQQWAANNGFEQGMSSGAFGFDGTTGGFADMAMNGMGDFSQMMQLMPNGMPNPMMNSFPNMMGMPGMGMDPMSMSQMYNGFGGQGMGMNNMNMGMGFDAGQGAFGGFNGAPPAWNAGQNKYNQNAYGGMGGDYGTNSGYGGYNMPQHQGNYNQMHQHQYSNNDFHQGPHGQGFSYRGRGRGRGYFNAGRGRGGYNQYHQYNQAQGNYANNEAFHQQNPEITRRGSPSYGPQVERPPPKEEDEDPQAAKAEETNKLTAEEQLNKELDPGDANDHDEEESHKSPATAKTEEKSVPKDAVATVPEAETQTKSEPESELAPKEEDKPAPIQTFLPDETPQVEAHSVEHEANGPSTMPPPPSPMIPTGPASYDTSQRGRGSNRGYSRGAEYRAGPQGRGTGYPANTNVNNLSPVTKPIVPPTAPKGLGVEGAPKAPKALREGQPNTGVRGFSIVGRASAAAQGSPNGVAKTTRTPSRERSRSRSRSRSPHRHQSSHHRHRRHRSSSPSSSTEREKRRERRHRHSRRHEAEEKDDYYDVKDPRNRDTSADSSSKRSSHRSRRHHTDDREKDGERSSHRSHRSHRDRSRDKEREREERGSKKREKSPELVINGASRRNGTDLHVSSRHKDEDEVAPPSSSRKRRSEDEEEYRDHKRKRRTQDEDLNDNKEPSTRRSSYSTKHDAHATTTTTKVNSSHHNQPENHHPPPTQPYHQQQEKPIPKGPRNATTTTAPAPTPSNTMLSEREKYAAERIARENQRRLGQKGPGGGVEPRGVGKMGTSGGRRIRYEDEDTVLRGEREREGLRYR
ncbi:hypothetical protein ACLMJK_004816 [Lecanora helva]